jgi:eukaryotic-like serine/threonine-protein kinase
VQLAPDRPGLCINLMLAYEQLGRYDEARLVYEMARQRKFDSDLLRTARFVLAFLEGDHAGMQEQVKWGEGKPSVEDQLLEEWAAAAAYYGRFGEARNIEARARAIALRNGAAERMIDHQADAALREAEVGNYAMARDLARKALASRPGRSTATKIALALAKAGDSAAAEQVAGELKGKYQSDPLLASYEMATIRALIELNKRKYDDAIAILRPALQYDFAQGLSGLQPAYVRGLAYLGASRGTEAASEFQKLVSHPGMVELSVTGALARLQLARAEQLSGNIEIARTHYQDFFALWKDADPDIPILQQAKKEYAGLK